MDKESRLGCFFVQEIIQSQSVYTNSSHFVKVRYYQQLLWQVGIYSHKGWVTPLCWYQDIRVQTTHASIKQRFTARSGKLVTLELQYRTTVSMCNAISFQDRPHGVVVTIQEKGKVPGENHTCFAFKISKRTERNPKHNL